MTPFEQATRLERGDDLIDLRLLPAPGAADALAPAEASALKHLNLVRSGVPLGQALCRGDHLPNARRRSWDSSLALDSHHCPTSYEPCADEVNCTHGEPIECRTVRHSVQSAVARVLQ